jgi:hypothetical protein
MSTFARGDIGRMVRKVTVNGTTPVNVVAPEVNANSIIVHSIDVVGGTQSALTIVKTNGQGFSVTAAAGNTGTYNFVVLS